MKRIIILSMIAIAAAGFISCSEDEETKADLKWRNDAATVSEIQWVKSGSTSVDQTWSGTYNTTDETAFKGIKELNGSGECVSGGDVATILLDTTSSTGTTAISSGSASIQENADAMLVISSTAKKK